MRRAHPRKGKLIADLVEDINAPISIDACTPNAHTAMRERNDFLLSERSMHGRRTKVRIAFEVYCRGGMRPMNYERLPGEHMIISCPSPDQARAAIRLIQRVCESLDGKFLAEDE